MLVCDYDLWFREGINCFRTLPTTPNHSKGLGCHINVCIFTKTVRTFESIHTWVQSTKQQLCLYDEKKWRKVSPPFNLANILLGNVVCSAIRFIIYYRCNQINYTDCNYRVSMYGTWSFKCMSNQRPECSLIVYAGWDGVAVCIFPNSASNLPTLHCSSWAELHCFDFNPSRLQGSSQGGQILFVTWLAMRMVFSNIFYKGEQQRNW